jgi:hypothetical protein
VKPKIVGATIGKAGAPRAPPNGAKCFDYVLFSKDNKISDSYPK